MNCAYCLTARAVQTDHLITKNQARRRATTQPTTSRSSVAPATWPPTGVKPYYLDDSVCIIHGDCREVLPIAADVLVTDPPYGVGYLSGWDGVLARSIEGDQDTTLRDGVLRDWEPAPALVFGTWRAPRPAGVRQLLIWDTQGALGMGTLDLPWKPSHQEIYVFGSGFVGRRTNDVLSFHPCQASAYRGRVHPHEKPVALLRELIGKSPPGTVLDPFMGSGTTLRAAKDLGRKAIGIEISEAYCEIAAKRMAQAVLL